MLTKVIPSYLYWEYQDDPDLPAFVASFNTMAQEYVDWFNQISLPVYTGPLIVGDLLDWVASGLYGMSRPALPSGQNQNLGPYNTVAYNSLAYNDYVIKGPSNFYATTDDIFKRIMTWNFYKGDGYVFNIRWLKRRIMRFLNGVNGTDPMVDQTYQISVTFGIGNQVNIRILTGLRTITGGSMYNKFGFNSMSYNHLNSTFISYSKFELAPILQSAIISGAVQLPFQFDYVVTV